MRTAAALPWLDINPDTPLGGSASLRECWRSARGHFRRLSGVPMDYLGLIRRSFPVLLAIAY